MRGRTRISTSEQETVIVIPRDASQPVRISTSDSTMMTKMDKLIKSGAWKLTRTETVGGEAVEKFYEYPDRLTSISASKRKGKPMTEEQKQKMRQALEKYRASLQNA